jgi:predicted AlkP superfamily phosphohydrolase/phosphomutase
MTARRALVIGLDAATWDIVDPLLARGELPNLARLVEAGPRGPLRSTIPPLTFCAWPAIMTGKNPGQIGIFSFYEQDLTVYERGKRVSTARPLVGQTWFDLVGQAGGRVISYGVPMTYPAWPVNGAMVSGFPTPDMTRTYAYPAELEARIPGLLPAESREVPREAMASADAVAWSLEMVDRYYRSSLEALRELFAEGQVGLCMVAENLTDLFVHRFWWLRDPSFPTHDAGASARVGDPIAEVYRRTDTWIGDLLDLAGPDALVAVVSDHGSGSGATRLWSPNAWLRQQGLLFGRGGLRRGLVRSGFKVARAVAEAVGVAGTLRARAGGSAVGRARADIERIDWSRTRAYRIAMYPLGGGIHLNVRGRQPQGTVQAGREYEELRDRIIAGLLEIRDPRDGTQVVRLARRREDLYSGPFVERAPDIVFLNDPRYRSDWRLAPLTDDIPLVALRRHSGDHRLDGLLAFRGAGVFRAAAQLEGANVTDVAPTLLHALGLPVPDDMDGRVLEEAFEAGFLLASPVQRGAAVGAVESGRGEYSQDEEAGIREALRGLGYIE